MVKVVRCPPIARQYLGNEIYGSWPLHGHPEAGQVDIMKRRRERRHEQNTDELRTLAEESQDCTFEPED